MTQILVLFNRNGWSHRLTTFTIMPSTVERQYNISVLQGHIMMDMDLLQSQCIHDGAPTLLGKTEQIQYCLVTPHLMFQEIQQVLLVGEGASIPILFIVSSFSLLWIPLLLDTHLVPQHLVHAPASPWYLQIRINNISILINKHQWEIQQKTIKF